MRYKYTFKDYMTEINAFCDRERYYYPLKQHIESHLDHFQKCYDMNIGSVWAMIGLDKILKGEEFNYDKVKRVR